MVIQFLRFEHYFRQSKFVSQGNDRSTRGIGINTHGKNKITNTSREIIISNVSGDYYKGTNC